MMLGAYQWAFLRPMRKLQYNMAITLASVVVALLIGGIEALGLAGSLMRNSGGFWRAIEALNGDLNVIGFAVVALFGLAWGLSFLLVRLTRVGRQRLT
jgi:high-affinity nickel-transport protein